MTTLKSISSISLGSTREVSEKMVEDKIKENPSMLGLGDLSLSTSQKRQKNGIVDLILEDEVSSIKYIVELQLGKLDPSHIIRLVEYWDIERKMNPDFQYKAILIAEDTTRYLNVLSLLQKAIPVIVIQMIATRISDKEIGLFFTKVLDYIENDITEPEEETTRQHWEKRASIDTLKIADEIFKILQSLNEELKWGKKFELKYNKHYIGLKVNGKSDNFIAMQPQKNQTIMWSRTLSVEEMKQLCESAEVLYVLGRGQVGVKAKAIESKVDVDIIKKIITESYATYE